MVEQPSVETAMVMVVLAEPAVKEAKAALAEPVAKEEMVLGVKEAKVETPPPTQPPQAATQLQARAVTTKS